MSYLPNIRLNSGSVQRIVRYRELVMNAMMGLKMSIQKPIKQYYNEPEAANLLCITLLALYQILDRHVFSPENPRPDHLKFTYSELLLLSVWAQPERGHNIVEMPHAK